MTKNKGFELLVEDFLKLIENASTNEDDYSQKLTFVIEAATKKMIEIKPELQTPDCLKNDGINIMVDFCNKNQCSYESFIYMMDNYRQLRGFYHGTFNDELDTLIKSNVREIFNHMVNQPIKLDTTLLFDTLIRNDETSGKSFRYLNNQAPHPSLREPIPFEHNIWEFVKMLDFYEKEKRLFNEEIVTDLTNIVLNNDTRFKTHKMIRNVKILSETCNFSYNEAVNLIIIYHDNLDSYKEYKKILEETTNPEREIMINQTMGEFLDIIDEITKLVNSNNQEKK